MVLEKQTSGASRPDRVSLVVPMRDEQKSIGALITTIRNQRRHPDEVILVDGGSTDRTVRIARELTKQDPRFRVIEAGPATPGRGRNVGIETATNEWIALTDAGIKLEVDWLAELCLSVDSQPDAEIIYGTYEPICDTHFTQCARLAYVPPRLRRGPGVFTRGPSIVSALLKRHVWSSVGGFPDRRASEDNTFMEAVEQAGFRIGWAPKAVIHWSMRQTLAQTFSHMRLYATHTALAGRQREWHYGVARTWIIATVIILLSVFHNTWWLAVVSFLFVVRAVRRILIHRSETGWSAVLNPTVFMSVLTILFAIDLATFLGWIEARFTNEQTSKSVDPPTRASE